MEEADLLITLSHPVYFNQSQMFETIVLKKVIMKEQNLEH